MFSDNVWMIKKTPNSNTVIAGSDDCFVKIFDLLINSEVIKFKPKSS